MSYHSGIYFFLQIKIDVFGIVSFANYCTSGALHRWQRCCVCVVRIKQHDSLNIAALTRFYYYLVSLA